MMYLIDQYAPDHPIYPKSAPVRAQIDRLLFRDISFAFYHISNLVVRTYFLVAEHKIKSIHENY